MTDTVQSARRNRIRSIAVVWPHDAEARRSYRRYRVQLERTGISVHLVARDRLLDVIIDNRLPSIALRSIIISTPGAEHDETSLFAVATDHLGTRRHRCTKPAVMFVDRCAFRLPSDALVTVRHGSTTSQSIGCSGASRSAHLATRSGRQAVRRTGRRSTATANSTVT